MTSSPIYPIASSRLAIATALLLGGVLSLYAAPTVLTFEGLQDQELISGYYGGGTGGFGSGPGPNYGVTFGNMQALVSYAFGGNGNFANNPSGFTAAFLPTGNTDTMNVSGGFAGGLGFYYVGVDPYNVTADAGSVAIFSGPNGTGTQLASFSLPPSPLDGNPTYNTWIPIGTGFSGTAESVVFTGYANYLGLDNVTLGDSTPLLVPENAGWSVDALAALGLFCANLIRSRHRGQHPPFLREAISLT
jgi:hypothetical protein